MKKLLIVDEETGEQRQCTNEEAFDLALWIIESLEHDEAVVVSEITKNRLLHLQQKAEYFEEIKGGD